MTNQTVYPQLTVEHNHGILILKDATEFHTLEGYRCVKGTCIGGGATSRLFSATSYSAFKTGVEKSWMIGSSRIYQDPCAEVGCFCVSACFF